MKETRVRSLIWIPHAAEELNLSTTTIEPVLWAGEPQLLKFTWPRFHRLQQEKPPQWEACTPQLESNPRSPQLEKSLCSSKGPAEPEINKIIKKKKKVKKKITTKAYLKKLKNTTNTTISQLLFPSAGSPKCQWPLPYTLLKVKCSRGDQSGERWWSLLLATTKSKQLL